MSKIKFIILLIAGMIFLFNPEGKAMAKKPSSYYKEQLEKIDYSDGIDEEEATIIAQSYISDKKIKGVNSPSVLDNKWWIPKGCWEVRFKTSFKIKMKHGLTWFSVYINKDRGDIKGSGWGPD